ncbi:peptidyl-prolyl cis-trans isomerase-like 4 [Exaiptasia diaphana]|uniref:Peptidyl-prolyl cis-trans isomerase n=1 Tax=Exaiptasia diaphana TaxID=2652724 RepID=A0A913Y3I8_EXADI|nr:peptidyl-prolyl cis-trans isomerase-like 4 [Exaiptasia diaphana]KXJ22762.1 Peptidyl-prolyl cis-trans isomerase-like 4 [Exaiptasia diaphana]
MSVLLETTVGDIVIDLFTEERPRACLNFLKLCKIKYYNYCLFHSVQRNFTAQTGDPTGTGKGGDSVFRSLYGDQARLFEAETKPRLKHTRRGTVSMVNNGDNMHGSQFFITLADGLTYLDGVHTVFGEVSEGFDILKKINETICDDAYRPYQDIRISHTVILDDPFDDPSGLEVPDRSPEPTKEQLESGRIGADEKVDDTEGKTMEEIDEMIANKEQKAGAQILEMIGDIPDADVKPPENVLFVCKLNPVTTDEDLEIIFSRFGTITSCEIVRDQKSGESLQYAFIEFEKEEDCERAYFKMDNVLIDDRRIHVDFSQSVAHLNWNKQGAKPIISEKKEEKQKYAVKNTTRKDSYDLVYENSSGDERKTRNDKDSHKRHKHHRSSSSSDDDKRKRKHKVSDNNSSTRKRKERREYHSSDEEYKKKDKREDKKYKRKDRREYSSDEEDRRRNKRTEQYSDERRTKERKRKESYSSDDDKNSKKRHHSSKSEKYSSSKERRHERH